MVEEIDDEIKERYFKFINDPKLTVITFIKELIEDSVFILDVETLPDQFKFESLQKDCNAAKERFKEELENNKNQEIDKDRGVFMSQYTYSDDLIWKYEMLKSVLNQYNQPMLNLHFMSPYMKNYSASIVSYNCIIQLFQIMSEKQRPEIIDNLQDEILLLKEALKKKEQNTDIYKIMPLFHLLIMMMLNFQMTEHKDIIKSS